jgi:hypothetical protein
MDDGIKGEEGGGGGGSMVETKGYTIGNTLGKRKKARAPQFDRREGDWVCPKCRQLIVFSNIPNTPVDLDQSIDLLI